MIIRIDSLIGIVLFTVIIVIVTLKNPLTSVGDYPPAVRQKCIELGLIAERKQRFTRADLIRKGVAMVVFVFIFALILKYFNGADTFWQGFAESTKEVKAEVQIRTIAMDFWASLEHQIKYKKNVEHAEKVIARLKECADEIAHVDETMQEIRIEMDNIKEETTDVEALYEKLKKIDINFM